MNQEEIKDVFTKCGLGGLGEQLAYKLWLKGLGEKSNEETLEAFLLNFGIHEEDTVYADEFYFHFQIFQTVIKNEDLCTLFLS